MEKCKESLVKINEWNIIRKTTKYPTLGVVKKWILKQESNLAKNFADIKSFKLNSNSQLEVDFEWFLTWRLKIAKFPHVIWRDGVEIEILKQSGEFRFDIESKIWIGPESNVNIEFLCNMSGFVVPNKHFDKFENYRLDLLRDKDF
jgi:hypothetical protein